MVIIVIAINTNKELRKFQSAMEWGNKNKGKKTLDLEQ